MSKPSRDPSVFDEPHLRGKPLQPDPSEGKADRALAGTRASRTSDKERVEHSVWDEPGLSPTLAGPAPQSTLTYRGWIEKRRSEIGEGKSWAITIAVAALAGPWAILGALMASMYGQGAAGVLAICVFGPVVEEVMKVAAGMYVVEKRPFFFRSGFQIVICALAGGLVFACIENLVYLNVYIHDPSLTMVRWRWTICVALHMGCSFIAGLGLMRIWRDTWHRTQRPRIHLGFPYLVAAMVLHGAYNAFALVLALADFRF